MNRISTTIFTVGVAACALVACDQRPELAAEPGLSIIRGAEAAAIDTIFADYNGATPGCAVAVDYRGEIIHSQGYGMADLEQGIAFSPDSAVYAGSVSKQVVAMAAMILDRQGKIDLDATVRTYLPELPPYADTITVRQILHHTSGIRDYFNLFFLAGQPFGAVITEDDILALLAQQRGLNFEPGERWAYSNSAYFLISQIVKAVEGRDLDDFAQEHIFGPLGMSRSHFQHNHRRLIQGKAHGYAPQDDGSYLTDDSTLDVVGSGGMYTTVEDLIRWDRNFYDSQLGTGQDIVDEMQTTGYLNSGEPTDYGFALGLRTYRGLKLVSHGGALAGYRAVLSRFPDQQFSVAILCNSSAATPGVYSVQISDIFMSEFYTEELEDADGADASGDERADAPASIDLSPYLGSYYSDEVDNTLTITLGEDGLQIGGVELPDGFALAFDLSGGDKFADPNFGVELAFDRDDDGQIAGFTYNGPRVAALRFALVDQ